MGKPSYRRKFSLLFVPSYLGKQKRGLLEDSHLAQGQGKNTRNPSLDGPGPDTMVSTLRGLKLHLHKEAKLR